MKCFLIFALFLVLSRPSVAQDVREKLLVYYVPWKAKFKGPLNERTIKEMNNEIILHDTISNYTIINEIKDQLTKLELLDTIYGDLDLRMVCVLIKKDNAKQMFSFDYTKTQIRMNSKVYYSNPKLLSLIEKNIIPHQENFGR